MKWEKERKKMQIRHYFAVKKQQRRQVLNLLALQVQKYKH